VTVSITWRQVLAWRLGRQLLDPIGQAGVADVVRRLCGVQAQVVSSAELAVSVRRDRSVAGEVGLALEAGDLIRTWAMRGTLHLLTPEDGGALLSLVAAGRSWERPSWQRYFGVTPAVIDALRVAVDEALAGATLTREELSDRIVERPSLAHLGDGLRSGWGTLLKPVAWQGGLCLGPSRGSRVTFRRPVDASPRWAGLPVEEVAAPTVLRAYLGVYGPSTIDRFGDWLAGGWFGKRMLRAWIDALADELVEVDVEGERLLHLAVQLDDLAGAAPTETVRLLPGFDQYVLGPGTDDGRAVAPARRSAVSKQGGWIAPVVVTGGIVTGTWELAGTAVRVSWFAEHDRPAPRRLEAEVDRLGAIVGRDLELALSLV
jgi:hypothetical protein